MRMCKDCGESLTVDKFEKNRQVCKKCRQEKRKTKHKHTCEHCSKEFTNSRTNAKYCSKGCQGKARISRVSVVCANCGNDKQVVPSLYDRLDSFYCNQECRNTHLKVLMAGERNHNYSKIKTKCSGCGESFDVQPHRLKNHAHQFCSYSCYKSNIGQYFKGENNPLWNGSLSAEHRIKARALTEYREWRFSVYTKDNYTCVLCGDSSGGNLNAHHLNGWDKYPDERFDIDNGVTLCKTCHTNFHDKYGYGSNTRLQFNEYIKTYQKTC